MSSYATLTTVSVVPGSTTTAPLFGSTTLCNWALVYPLPGNTATNSILFDTLGTPVNTTGFSMPYIQGGRPYNLAQINVKAGNTTDGVLVIYGQG
jgi:hypothetical protein